MLERRLMSAKAEQTEYVDLGLPSGLLWARGNIVKDSNGNYSIGSEKDYGTYFMWADVTGHNNGEGYSFNSTAYKSTPGYSLTGSIKVGDSSHDTALALLGSPWRLPTRENFIELTNNTDTEWFDDYEGSGVAGRKFMKKTDHSVYVFFPAGGSYQNTTLYNLNDGGKYWSSTFYSDRTSIRYGYSLYIYSSGSMYTTNESAYYGCSVRPVCGNFYDFNYTQDSNYHNIYLDAGQYKLECWGAEGGGTDAGSTTKGGKGGYSVGVLTLTTRTLLYVHVGHRGTCTRTNNNTLISGIVSGGYNGGGDAYSDSKAYYISSGGGASDIRLRTSNLNSRVIVAGGGGGYGKNSHGTVGEFKGGDGGGTSGGSGLYNGSADKAGRGGSSTARGTSYYVSTSDSTTYGTLARFGYGGGAKGTSYNISGGGGGWYGGGYSVINAGGGSGYVYTSSTAGNYPSGCTLSSSDYLVNASTTKGDSTFLSPSGIEETGHSGNGYVRITKLS